MIAVQTLINAIVIPHMQHLWTSDDMSPISSQW